MLKNLTNKQKSILLLVGIFLTVLVSYNLAFKKTFTLKSQCKETEQKLNYLNNAPQRISQIKAKIDNIDRKVGKNRDYPDTEEYLLEKISELCHKRDVIFTEFPGHHSITGNEYTIETYQMILQGRYTQLLLVLYELEKSFTLGKIASVEFFTKKIIRSGKMKLNMKLIVQSIKLNENEEKRN